MLLGLLAVVAAIVLLVWQPWRGGDAPDPAATGQTPPAATGETPAPTGETPEPTGDPSEEPTASVTPTPEPEPAEPVACTEQHVSVTAVADKTEYAPGENPQLSIMLANVSAVPCSLNVGTAAQSFVVTSGSDVWWRSTDCQLEPSDNVVQLEPGQEVASAAPVVWDRTRSAPETCTDARPDALPGTYHLTVTVGGIPSSETASFVLL